MQKSVNIKKANGMGSVYRLQGNRRKPWIACVTQSISQEDGGYRQKRKIVGYYESEELAEFSLWNYNKNPILFEEIQKFGSITFETVYLEWSKMKFRCISQNAINGYKAAYTKCTTIWHVKISELKTIHFQRIMDESTLSIASDLKLKSLMVLVCEYAMQNDIINKNYARYVILNKKEETPSIHTPFIEKEIQRLFANDELPMVDSILIMIYTGFRISELFAIKHSDVDLKNMTIRGGNKTQAGKNRLVPIHERIQGYILNYYKQNNEYLICDVESKERMNYHTYRSTYFDKIMNILNMNHLPHDCRHTFATRLNNAGANTTSIRKLIGHSSFATTEKIYTHKDIGQLRVAIYRLK